MTYDEWRKDGVRDDFPHILYRDKEGIHVVYDRFLNVIVVLQHHNREGKIIPIEEIMR